mgnify:CR=1 FL=1
MTRGAGYGDAGLPQDVPQEMRKCYCGIDCAAKISQSAANTGRAFFSCPKQRDVRAGRRVLVSVGLTGEGHGLVPG